jgi:hypothetical protein
VVVVVVYLFVFLFLKWIKHSKVSYPMIDFASDFGLEHNFFFFFSGRLFKPLVVVFVVMFALCFVNLISR